MGCVEVNGKDSIGQAPHLPPQGLDDPDFPNGLGFFNNLKKYPEADFSLKQQTDLIVRCNGKEFHLHKIILGTQSEFFEKACNPDSPFTEAKTGVISLDDDDPILIKFVFAFCYTCSIDMGILDELYSKRAPEHANLLRCIDAYSTADKYRFTGLKDGIKAEFRVHFSRFTRRGTLSPSFFTKMTMKIFESTPSTDRGLREQVILYASKHLDSLIVHEQFKDNANSIDGFWSEVMSLNFRTRKRGRQCPSCKGISTTSFDDGEKSAQCKKCRAYRDIDDWNQPAADLQWHHDGEYSSSDEEGECEASSNKRKRTEEPNGEDGATRDGDKTVDGNINRQESV
ncbi:hypothetical protein IWZ00DRAFT_556764 [Phyllosticta capitalensis]